MKKHCRYLKIFTMLAVLLGLAVAAWSDAGEDREPNTPVEGQELTNPGEGREPNTPIESQEPNIPVESRELAIPVESREPNIPIEGQEPNTPIESQELTTPGESQEPTGPTYGQEQPNPADSWDTYKIVVERNMFSRQRGPRVDRSRRQRQVPVAPPAPDPESYVVLKGIVQEDGAFIAFLEDTQSGQILRVHKGDKVVRGVITDMGLDSLEYRFEDRTTTVTMGFNLQGGRDGTTFTGMYELSQTYSSTAEEGTTEPSSPPTEDEAEILRQLMERRQQQVGQ